MKKIKNLAIIILMITMLIILSIKVEATEGTINSETVRVREEASTKSTILMQLDKGEKVEILEQSEGWYKVSITKNGEKVTGYISEKLLDVESTAEVSKPEDKEPENNTTEANNQENTTEVNSQPVVNDEPTENTATKVEEGKEYNLLQTISVKRLPLMNSKEKATIENGNIKVVEVINDWCKIENSTTEGWIRINSLKKAIEGSTVSLQETTTGENLDNSNTGNQEKSTDAKVIKTAYVSAESLKVRKEASTSSEVIDSLKKNDQVSIIEELDGWYKIKIGTNIGYVSSKYISDNKVAETTSRGNTTRTEENEVTTPETPVKTVENTPASSATGTAVVEYAKQYLGYKYVSGGASPEAGFDCSGFTTYVYKHFGITLNRVSKDQSKNGVAVEKSNLQPGDLVLFNGESNKTIGHVGIYVGSGNFIHASNPKGGVKITALDSSYYNIRYVGARRVIE